MAERQLILMIIFPYNGTAREVMTDAVYIDDDKSKGMCGREIIGREAILAVPGRPENFRERDKIIDSLGDVHFVNSIHPSVVTMDDLSIGYNVLIMAGVVITSNVTIGNHVIILPNTVISHDSIIEDYSIIGSNVSIAGGVTIGRCSYIGSGSSIKNDIHIGEKTLVGLGSVVVKDTEAGSTVYGNPAK